MKQEDKELLLKDICATLPFKNGDSKHYVANEDGKPYLRPLSSMTLEDMFEFKQLYNRGLKSILVSTNPVKYIWRDSDGYMFWTEYI